MRPSPRPGPEAPSGRAQSGRSASSIDWGAQAEKALDPLIDVLLAEDRAAFREALIDGAKELLPAGSGKPGHWLCELLAEIAKRLDPGTYIDELAETLKERLTDGGVDPLIAKVVASAARQGLKKVQGGMDPFAAMRLYLWLLICMVCPNPDDCPAEPAAGLEILKKELTSDSSY